MGLFNKKEKAAENEICNITLHLNMRLMPKDRWAFFEDPIDEVLHKYDLGEVTGGGTLSTEERMPLSCDIDIRIKKDKIEHFISFMKHVNTAAKGSYIEYDGKKEEIGVLEGLSLILDGTGLDENVYKENDINDVIADIDNLINGKGQYHSYYIGEQNTNLYFYGNSFEEMKKIILEYIKTSPLCENSIIEQI
ncbi:MAG: hypothetical protein K2I14_02860 [Eubacterium sp.]|nr:hypothetical protein [Eubacterium sp.]